MQHIKLVESHFVYWASCSSRISTLFVIVNVVLFVCNNHRLLFNCIDCCLLLGLNFDSCWFFITIDCWHRGHILGWFRENILYVPTNVGNVTNVTNVYRLPNSLVDPPITLQQCIIFIIATWQIVWIITLICLFFRFVCQLRRKKNTPCRLSDTVFLTFFWETCPDFVVLRLGCHEHTCCLPETSRQKVGCIHVL